MFIDYCIKSLFVEVNSSSEL